MGEDVQKEAEKAPAVELVHTGETKEIAGYECEKVLANTKDDGKTYATAWVAKDMDVPENINFSNPVYAGLDGMLLEFQMDTGNGMMLTFTAIEVDNKKIKDKEFEVPEGFKETTREELQQSLGG